MTLNWLKVKWLILTNIIHNLREIWAIYQVCLTKLILMLGVVNNSRRCILILILDMKPHFSNKVRFLKQKEAEKLIQGCIWKIMCSKEKIRGCQGMHHQIASSLAVLLVVLVVARNPRWWWAANRLTSSNKESETMHTLHDSWKTRWNRWKVNSSSGRRRVAWAKRARTRVTCCKIRSLCTKVYQLANDNSKMLMKIHKITIKALVGRWTPPLEIFKVRLTNIQIMIFMMIKCQNKWINLMRWESRLIIINKRSL